MPSLIRCGCTLLALLLCVAIGVCAAVLWFATRDTGPQYYDGSYTVDTVDGGRRVDNISRAAAQRFDAKRDVQPSPQEVARLQLQGIDFSEEEVNSYLAQQLSQQPLDSGGVRVERIFVELHPQRTVAYLYTSLFGLHVTFSSQVTFRVVNNTARVELGSPRAGQLPIGLVLPELLKWSGNTDRVARELAVALPPQVTGIQPREGALHIAVNIFRLARAHTASRPLAGRPAGRRRGPALIASA